MTSLFELIVLILFFFISLGIFLFGLRIHIVDKDVFLSVIFSTMGIGCMLGVIAIFTSRFL